MAMYYQSSSEIQADGLHTLYLMNPNYVAYSDTQPNMLFFNPASSSSSSSASAVIPHAPLPFTGIPFSHDPTRSLPPPAALAEQQDIPAEAAQTPIPRLHYNMWGLVDQQSMPQQTPRGLSLSLSAHHQAAGAGFDKPSVSGDHEFPTAKNCSPPSSESNGVNTMIMGSKYLKAAQELLDEVVNLRNEAAAAAPRKDKAKAVKDKTVAAAESGIKSELTTAQRQEIQMKKSKLNTMLDEVEQRRRQYHEQMQIVVAAFEQAAGSGSARAYTQLGLKTILKQFRCLKSTISAQIKGLGDEESLDNKFQGSRLQFVDSQLRQQRALQQLGMMQNNAWRPQRGLPERAVSVLRAWLFEHFLHPYPKDSDKQMLAKQTGLTRSQVSNWFINARVRLWKPMVEEMYLEETKNQHDASIKLELPDNKPGRAALSSPPAPAAEISASTLSTASPSRTNFAQLISSLNMDSLQAERNPKKARNAMNINEVTTGNYLSMAGANVNRYGIDQQVAGNGFSLSLALQPTHESSQQQQQQFLSHRNMVEGGGMNEGNNINIGYHEILDFQNSRKQFPAQLLPDFVA